MRDEYFNYKIDEFRLIMNCVNYCWQYSQISDSQLNEIEKFVEDIMIELYGSDCIS